VPPAIPATSRVAEATTAQIASSGAWAGSYDPIDPQDAARGYRRLGTSGREVPQFTLDKLRTHSVAAWRTNPMARAIIETYVHFCVGDSGLTLQSSDPQVEDVARRFWTDPRNRVGPLQEGLLRDHLLMGETVLEMLVGPVSGVTRFSLIDPQRVTGVLNEGGNPLWPQALAIREPGGIEPRLLPIVNVDDLTELRTGQVQFWRSGRGLLTDTRGAPFLGPVIDWLDSYDAVLSNLIDRTALGRYLVWDVTLDGATEQQVADFITARGGARAPQSGTIEVHNDAVHWDTKSAQLGSYEDTNTAKNVLTSVASGAGLSKPWLAEPEDANRATSISMAEPVRRRIAGVQATWIDHIAELVRYQVDQAVARGRLPRTVSVAMEGGKSVQRMAAETVTVTGPEVAAADAQITAEVMHQLGQGLTEMVAAGVMTKDAARLAARKAWEDYLGVPYRADLDKGFDSNTDDLATHVDANRSTTTPRLEAVAGGQSA
jgi:hypothetical protein